MIDVSSPSTTTLSDTTANTKETLKESAMNRIDRYIATCPSWEEFWERTRKLSEADMGRTFERLVQLYLQTEPEYRTTLAERIGARARSRLFEMCRVIKMPSVEDYRIKKAR